MGGGSTACSACLLEGVDTSMFLSALSAFSAVLAASSQEVCRLARRHCLDGPFRNGRSWGEGGGGGLPNPRLSVTHAWPFCEFTWRCASCPVSHRLLNFTTKLSSSEGPMVKIIPFQSELMQNFAANNLHDLFSQLVTLSDHLPHVCIFSALIW